MAAASSFFFFSHITIYEWGNQRIDQTADMKSPLYFSPSEWSQRPLPGTVTNCTSVWLAPGRYDCKMKISAQTGTTLKSLLRLSFIHFLYWDNKQKTCNHSLCFGNLLSHILSGILLKVFILHHCPASHLFKRSSPSPLRPRPSSEQSSWGLRLCVPAPWHRSLSRKALPIQISPMGMCRDSNPD